MWPVFQEGIVTAEVLHTIDVLESLSVSEAENQCLLIAMDYVTKEPRPALFLLTQQLLQVGQVSGKSIIWDWVHRSQLEQAFGSLLHRGPQQLWASPL